MPMDNQSHSVTTRPNPDPTSLTTEQLHREMEWVKQIIEDHVTSERNNLADRKALFLDLLKSGDELMNERINGVIREMVLVNDAAKTAVAKSEAGYEKRFESVNEFRQQLVDQAARFITSVESRALHKATDDKLSALTDRFNRRDGMTTGKDDGKSDMRSNVATLVSVLVGMVSLFLFLTNLNSRVERNTDYRTNQTQQAK